MEYLSTMALNKMELNNQNKYNEGDSVYEITRPKESMLITRRNGIIYYCRSVYGEKGRETAFMERDLRKYIAIKW